MTDALGWRAKFGVLAPSTNTIVEPDFYRMSVPGVTANAAIWWMALRDNGIGEKLYGCGRLLREF
jgi:maleate isomerase